MRDELAAHIARLEALLAKEREARSACEQECSALRKMIVRHVVESGPNPFATVFE